RCTGCGICVASCPGLAIMVAQVKNGRAIFKIPHEFLPHPQKGETWTAVARNGTFLGHAAIEGVSLMAKTKTPVITVSVPIGQLYDFATVVKRCE
ncbi:MAG: 4Fe-4S ferredoxin, partial [bacterium]